MDPSGRQLLATDRPVSDPLEGISDQINDWGATPDFGRFFEGEIYQKDIVFV